MSKEQNFKDLLSVLHTALVLHPLTAGQKDKEKFPGIISKINSIFKKVNNSFFVDEKYKNFLWEYYDNFETGAEARFFSIIEILLKIAADNHLFYTKDYAGITEAYVLYVNEINDQYIHSEKEKRTRSLFFPNKDERKNFYILKKLNLHFQKEIECVIEKIKDNEANGENKIRVLDLKNDKFNPGKIIDELKESLKSTPGKKTEFEEHLDEIVIREILNSYTLKRRKTLKELQDKSDFYKPGEGDNYKNRLPFIESLRGHYSNRSEYEKTNQIFIGREGELLLALYLQRLAKIKWRIISEGEGDKKKYNTIEKVDDFTKSLELFLNGEKEGIAKDAKKILRFIGIIDDTEIKLTGAAERMFRWFEKLCARKNYKSLRSSLLMGKNEKGERKGFNLNDKKINELKDVLEVITGRTPGDLVANLTDFFWILLSSDKKEDAKILPYDFVELSTIFHIDTFLPEIYFAHHEGELNNGKADNIIRDLFIFPLDPIYRRQNGSDDNHVGVYALWVGYLENSLRNAPVDSSRKDNSIIRLKTVLNLLGQPIVREIIEKELHKSEIEKLASEQKKEIIEREHEQLKEIQANISHQMRNDLNIAQGGLLKFLSENENISERKEAYKSLEKYFSYWTDKFELLSRLHDKNYTRIISDGKFSIAKIIKESFFVSLMALFNRSKLRSRFNNLRTEYKSIEDKEFSIDSLKIKENQKTRLHELIAVLPYKVDAFSILFSGLILGDSNDYEKLLELFDFWNSLFGDFILKFSPTFYINEKEITSTIINKGIFNDDGQLILSSILTEIFVNMFTHGIMGKRDNFKHHGTNTIPEYVIKINLNEKGINIFTKNPKGDSSSGGDFGSGEAIIEHLRKMIDYDSSIISDLYFDHKSDQRCYTNNIKIVLTKDILE